jgi:uncharacterized Zn finger protein (UPF0148 family)
VGVRKRERRKLATCKACGAGLPPGPAACPLCGTEIAAATDAAPEPEDYQETIRHLRDELRRLREDGAA